MPKSETNEHPHVTVNVTDTRGKAAPAAAPDAPESKKPSTTRPEGVSVAKLDPMSDLFKLHAELGEMDFIKEAKGSTGNRDYKYQDLPSLMRQLAPVLASHNFVWYSKPGTKDSQPSLQYKLVHISGWVDEGEMLLMAKDLTPQDQGGAITYARRYAISAQLGIVADEDDDASKAQQAKVLQTKKLKEAGQPGRKRENDIYTMIKRIDEIGQKQGRERVTVEDYEGKLKKQVIDLTVEEADAEIARMGAYINRQQVTRPAVTSGQA